MPLSWNEIRHNAIKFSNEWTGETREEAEAKSFWDEFFAVFGIRRRTVASFEEPVKKNHQRLQQRSPTSSSSNKNVSAITAVQ